MAKDLAKYLGTVFGVEKLARVVDKAIEYVTEVFHAGEEMNRLNAQIAGVARETDNVNEITSITYLARLQNAMSVLNIKTLLKRLRAFWLIAQYGDRQYSLLDATENVIRR